MAQTLDLPMHRATCDKCRAFPIKGSRWRCTECVDYDLCDACRVAGNHKHHEFESVSVGLEHHRDTFCSSCMTEDTGRIQGVRYICQKHNDHDFCERCVKAGKACGGPYKLLKQTELGLRIEEQGCLPMSKRWNTCLMPPVATYHVERSTSTPTWLDWPSGLLWFGQPARERLDHLVDPVYAFEPKFLKGDAKPDHKSEWTMKGAGDKTLFTYMIETDKKTNSVKRQQFRRYKGKATLPVWRHGPGEDSLAFQDPTDGLGYCWRSNRPISTLNNERFDFQRYALFKQIDSKQRIIADFAFWDGHPEGSGQSLTIHDSNIDHAVVIASLTIMFDHQWRIMQEEKERDPLSVQATEHVARLTRRGAESYWHSSHVQPATTPSADRDSTRSSQRSTQTAIPTTHHKRAEFLEAVPDLLEIAGNVFNAVATN